MSPSTRCHACGAGFGESCLDDCAAPSDGSAAERLAAQRSMATLVVEPPRIVEGWPAIAEYLRVTVRGAQKRANLVRDPLPVRVGHRGVFAHVTALRDWISRQDMAYGVARRFERHGEALAMHGCKPRAHVRRKALPT